MRTRIDIMLRDGLSEDQIDAIHLKILQVLSKQEIEYGAFWEYCKVVYTNSK